jgi:hypothetical protein
MMAAQMFSRALLQEALLELGRRAHAEGKTIEIAIYGGSALMLMFDWRLATRDVDAVFERDRDAVRRFARDLARDHGWDENWLNDGVKGFLSAADSDPTSRHLFGTFPSEAEPGLRVLVANPRYLFAMKCLAMRTGGIEAGGDIEDIRRLAEEIGLANANEAMDLVTSFYPRQRLDPKVQFGLEEIFSDRPARIDSTRPGPGVQ